jgi:hypothetical protein
MAEQREENKKLCAWRRWFFAFSKLSQGAWGSGFPDRQAIFAFLFFPRGAGASAK